MSLNSEITADIANAFDTDLADAMLEPFITKALGINAPIVRY